MLCDYLFAKVSTYTQCRGVVLLTHLKYSQRISFTFEFIMCILKMRVKFILLLVWEGFFSVLYRLMEKQVISVGKFSNWYQIKKCFPKFTLFNNKNFNNLQTFLFIFAKPFNFKELTYWRSIMCFDIFFISFR